MRYNLDWFAFKNGANNIKTQEFIPIEEIDDGNDIVARKYIDSDVDVNAVKTPLFDGLLRAQLPPEAIDWFYILMARLFLPAGYDKLDVIPFIYGQSSTGKSTIRNVIASFFHSSKIGTINSNHEAVFGMDNFSDKQVLLANDLPEKLSDIIQVDLLKCMASGEVVNVARKNKKSIMEKRNIPSLLIANFLPDYDDAGGAVSKRLAIFIFRSVVKEQDSELEHKIIQQELPAILVKAMRAYHSLVKTTTFEAIRPAYFTETAQEYIESVENLYQFFNQCDSRDKQGNKYRIEFKENYFVPLEEVKRRYEQWCKFQKVKMNWKTGDYNVFEKFGLEVQKRVYLCKNCRQISRKDCCSKYSSDNRSQKTIVKGVKFMMEANQYFQ